MAEHTPGIFHVWILDDGGTWIDIFGNEHWIGGLDKDYAENILCYLVRNAERFWRVYKIEIEGVDVAAARMDAFDRYAKQFSQNWILRSACAVAVMRRILDFHE